MGFPTMASEGYYTKSLRVDWDTKYDGVTPDEKDKILSFQQSILESIASEKDHIDTLNALCVLEEMLLPNSVASIMLLNEQGVLNVYAAPNIPNHGIAQLNGLRPGPGAGSCGTAVYRQEPVYVCDTLTDPQWNNLRKIALDFGIMSCWSRPIRTSGNEVIGSFALSSFEHRSPTSFHIKLLEIGASITSIVLERARHQKSITLLGKVFECSNEGVIVTDFDQRIVLANQSFTKITGYALEEVFGKKPSVLSSGRHDKTFYKNLWMNVNRDGHWQGEIWNRRRNGEIYPEWLSISVIKDTQGNPVNYVGLFSDISVRKEAESKVQYLAFHDALTGLANREHAKNYFDQAIASADRENTKIAFLFLDLDNFKTINDSLGHVAGDMLLKRIASTLQSTTRHTDHISRYGGDEFLIQLFYICDNEDVSELTEEILLNLSEPHVINGYDLSSSFSIGISIYPDDGKDFDTLLKKSDTAMYKAKSAGRNTFCFYMEQMNAEAFEKLKLTSNLRRALEKKEFTLHYQPQVDIQTGKVCGAEALIRWVHPERGLVPPSQFIPIAEESGLIIPIGEWVLNEACRAASKWNDLIISVNLSAVQFSRSNMVDIVFNAIELAGLDPVRLELEITESALLHDANLVSEAIQKLKRKGIRLSIDDFGTGYSSLSYLKKLDVDKLKIDRSFVMELSNNSDDRAIVAAIIQMARSLGLKTIAEGVEDKKTMEILRTLQCEAIQGYVFSKPLPEMDFDNLLAKQQTQGYII